MPWVKKNESELRSDFLYRKKKKKEHLILGAIIGAIVWIVLLYQAIENRAFNLSILTVLVSGFLAITGSIIVLRFEVFLKRKFDTSFYCSFMSRMHFGADLSAWKDFDLDVVLPPGSEMICLECWQSQNYKRKSICKFCSGKCEDRILWKWKDKKKK